MNLWSDSKGFHRKTQKMIPAVILSWQTIDVFMFLVSLLLFHPLALCTSRTPLPTMLYSSLFWTEKRKDSRKFGRKRRPIRFRLFLCRVCFYQYCRFVHQKFWSVCRLFDEVTCFYFLDFFVVMMVSWRRAEPPLVLLDCGTTSELVLCTWTQTKRQCRKKLKNKQKIKKQTKRGCYLFRFCLYWNEKKILTLNKVDKE